MSRTRISNNTTSLYNGGGIAVGGDTTTDPASGADANATIANCKIFGNSAWKKGGGLRFDHVDPANTLKVVNTIIYGNSSSNGGDGHGDGAAIDAWQASSTLINCTVTNNQERASLGIIFAHTDGPPFLAVPVANVNLINSIIYDNSGGQLAKTLGANTSVAISFSNVDDGVNYPAGANGNINADPLFRDAANDDYRLQITSPAIDAGNNNAVPADSLDLDGDSNTAEPTPVDIDHSGRFFDAPNISDTGNGTAPIVDMGAYETIVSIDGDCDVDGSDLTAFLKAYGTVKGNPNYSTKADIEPIGGDGDVDENDLYEFAFDYGTVGCP